MQKKVQLTDLAWAAGIVDGEGCFFARARGKGAGTELKVRMTSVRTINKLHKIFKLGHVCFDKKPPKKKTHRSCWVWAVSTQRAAQVTELILPFLCTKKPEALIFLKILAFQKGKRGQRGQNERHYRLLTKYIVQLKMLKKVS